MRTIGYAESSCKSGKAVGDVYGNLRVKEAIARTDAKASEKLEHNRDMAIKLLLSDHKSLDSKAKDGNVQAIQARAGIVRELDAISNLHSSTVHTTRKAESIAEADKPILEDAARKLKLKLA